MDLWTLNVPLWLEFRGSCAQKAIAKDVSTRKLVSKEEEKDNFEHLNNRRFKLPQMA